MFSGHLRSYMPNFIIVRVQTLEITRDRQTDKQTDRQTDRQCHLYMYIHIYKYTYKIYLHKRTQMKKAGKLGLQALYMVYEIRCRHIRTQVLKMLTPSPTPKKLYKSCFQIIFFIHDPSAI